VVHTSEPDVIVAARRVSPLIMGVTDGAAFLASDIPAILGSPTTSSSSTTTGSPSCGPG